MNTGTVAYWPFDESVGLMGEVGGREMVGSFRIVRGAPGFGTWAEMQTASRSRTMGCDSDCVCLFRVVSSLMYRKSDRAASVS